MAKKLQAIVFHGFPDPPKKNSAILLYLKKNHYQVSMPSWVKNGKNPIDEKLVQKKFDLIVGISLGGFLAIELAKNKPQTKLLLIATGPYFASKIPLYNAALKLTSIEQSLFFINKIKTIKKETYRPIYKLFNWQVDISDKEYQKRADQNLKACQKISQKSYKTVLELIKATNYFPLLDKLENKTLIFASQNDKMMPLSLAEEMQESLTNSQLKIVKQLHYDVFQKKDWPILDQFLD